ncbi:hypothetical protein QVD17_33955 [Tagetes erecta]|uniref:Cation-transporting P-type ATPase N-terminal domain-containing protein n=1 Tax=Tagetes erecta TaxID=13708 RepID=A0AAD8JZB5_TARER|nr:hypothetical protein QVD17_33955 [Tagetes erecta]
MVYKYNTLPINSEPKKRWRRAYLTIHFSNTLLNITKNNTQIIPETIINVPNDHRVDQTQLIKLIVANKDLETLARFDGVKGLAETLDTDLANGINEVDVNRRRILYGSNTYQKPSPKGLFYFFIKAFKY